MAPGIDSQEKMKDNPQIESKDELAHEFLNSLSSRGKKVLIAYFIFMIYVFGRRIWITWLVNHPLVYNISSASYTAAITSGAHSIDHRSYILNVLAGIPFLILSSTLVWLMGSELGKPFVLLSAQDSPKLQKFINWTLKIEDSYILILVALSAIPFIPFASISSLIAGIKKINIYLFISVRIISMMTVNITLATLGYIYGEEVLTIIDMINKYSVYITIAIIIFTVISSKRRKALKDNSSF